MYNNMTLTPEEIKANNERLKEINREIRNKKKTN